MCHDFAPGMNDLGYVYSMITKIIKGMSPSFWPLHCCWFRLHRCARNRDAGHPLNNQIYRQIFLCCVAVSFAKSVSFQGFSGSLCSY
jgi:hypothetical protein